MCFMQTILTIVSFLNAIKIDNKLALAPICISLIICYISYGLANMYSPYDYVSFQIAFLCIAGLIINALFCLYFIDAKKPLNK